MARLSLVRRVEASRQLPPVEDTASSASTPLLGAAQQEGHAARVVMVVGRKTQGCWLSLGS